MTPCVITVINVREGDRLSTGKEYENGARLQYKKPEYALIWVDEERPDSCARGREPR